MASLLGILLLSLPPSSGLPCSFIFPRQADTGKQGVGPARSIRVPSSTTVKMREAAVGVLIQRIRVTCGCKVPSIVGAKVPIDR